MNDNDAENYKLLDYRLSQLEVGLNAVQATLKSISEQFNSLTPLQGRVEMLEKEVKKLDERMDELHEAPYRKDAQRWERVLGWVVQGVILACLAVILTKVGLK